MKIILHVGLHKTGSTSFQNSCRANERHLLEIGLLYPSTIADGKFSNQHADLPLNFLNGRRDLIERYLIDSAHSAKKADASALLLSSEDFSALAYKNGALTELHEMLDNIFDQVRYVLVLRNIRELFPSMIKQQLAHADMGLSTRQVGLYEEKLRAIFLVVERWRRCLGDDLLCASYTKLKQSSKGFCNALLRFACNEFIELPDEFTISERADNTSSDFYRDPFAFMTPLVRAALGIILDVNPYAPQVNQRLNELLDRSLLLAAPKHPDSLDEIATALSQAVEHVAGMTIKRALPRILKEFPDLAPTPLVISET